MRVNAFTVALSNATGTVTTLHIDNDNIGCPGHD